MFMFSRSLDVEGYRVLVSTCIEGRESLAFTYKAYINGDPVVFYGIFVPRDGISTATAVLRRLLLNVRLSEDLASNIDFYIRYGNAEYVSTRRLRRYLRVVNAGDGIIIASPFSTKGPDKARNEDSVGVLSLKYCGSRGSRLIHAFAIADGVSGLQAGDYASSFAVRSFLASALQLAVSSPGPDVADVLRGVLMDIHSELKGYGETHGLNTGTTFTGGVIMQSGNVPIVTILHIGDTRAYKVVGNTVNRLTVDHSLGGHVITQALGYVINNIDIARTMLSRNSYLVLTTDGVTDVLSDDRIAWLIYEYKYPRYIASALINAARDAGSSDDASALVIWRT